MSDAPITSHGNEIEVNGRQPEILGNIVDENMTAALALMAKDKGGAELECQIIVWPAADSSFTAKSYQAYADG